MQCLSPGCIPPTVKPRNEPSPYTRGTQNFQLQGVPEQLLCQGDSSCTHRHCWDLHQMQGATPSLGSGLWAEGQNHFLDQPYLQFVEAAALCWLRRKALLKEPETNKVGDYCISTTTCFIIFIISPFTAQHVSNVSTSIFRSLRLIVDLFRVLHCSGSMCVGVTVWFGWGGVVSLCRLKHSFTP